MGKQFDPRKVLRHIPNDLLRQFFTKQGAPLAVEWDTLAETEIEPIFESWQKLPENQRADVQVTLQDVNELSDPHALTVLAEAIHFHAPDRMTEFAAIEGRIDKAMWVYLTVRPAFEEAVRFARADMLSTGRYWTKRNGLPKVPLNITDAVKRSLETALVDFYSHEQGRGHWCTVEPYHRPNGNEYFFAYLDDYPDTHIVYSDTGEMCKQRERSAFDNVFVYCPEDGTLETFIRGGRKVREPLEALFCNSVLGVEVGPAEPNAAAFNLEVLKDPTNPLPTDPQDGIAEVRVRRLQLDVVNSPGRRITLEAGPRDHRDAVYQMIERHLRQESLPMTGVRVSAATVMLTFHGVNGDRPRTLTFQISHPSACDLKSKADDMRAIGERYLKRWGISR